MIALSSGAVEHMYHDRTHEAKSPILQVLSVKKVAAAANSGPGPDRYRLIVSDGIYYIQAMLATHHNGLVQSNEIDKNVIIQLNAFNMTFVGSRKIAVVTSVKVVDTAPDKIGQPAGLEQMMQGQDVAMKESKPVVKEATKPQAAPSAYKAESKKPSTVDRNAPSIYPIGALNPYNNKWTIKARVTQKSEVKTFNSARGEGKLFSVNLLDETGEIRGTAFNEAVDSIYNILEEGKVFLISQGRVNIAKKQWTNLSHEYEIMFDQKTTVVPCEDADNVPQATYQFVELGSLGDIEKDSTCDVIGVMKECGELGSVISKATSKNIPKREINLIDRSGFAVRLTLWGKTAESFELPESTILAFKGVKVGDFGGRSLNMMSSSTMTANPDIAEAHELRGWYDTSGSSASIQQYDSRMSGGGNVSSKIDDYKTIGDVRDNPDMGQGEKPDYFTLRATVMFIKSERLSYPACPTEKCNKKVNQDGDDAWICEKCDRTYPAPDHRYMLNLSVGDHTGQFWLSAFNEVGQMVLQCSANDIEKLRAEEGEDVVKEKVMESTMKTFDFSCRAKLETYNEVAKVKYQIVRASPIDWSKAGHQLIEMIQMYNI